MPDAAYMIDLGAACGYCTARLAERLGISPRHLRRVFKRQFGCTPERWLREQRLQAALPLLLTASSVKEVAHTLAFRHLSQFCREFRQYFGCTPTDYRKLQGGADEDPKRG